MSGGEATYIVREDSSKRQREYRVEWRDMRGRTKGWKGKMRMRERGAQGTEEGKEEVEGGIGKKKKNSTREKL